MFLSCWSPFLLVRLFIRLPLLNPPKKKIFLIIIIYNIKTACFLGWRSAGDGIKTMVNIEGRICCNCKHWKLKESKSYPNHYCHLLPHCIYPIMFVLSIYVSWFSLDLGSGACIREANEMVDCVAKLGANGSAWRESLMEARGSLPVNRAGIPSSSCNALDYIVEELRWVLLMVFLLMVRELYWF